jgi:chemotaxis protein methyltransferase CheR
MPPPDVALAPESVRGSVRPISAREFQQFRDLVYRSFGLDLREGKEQLVSARLQKILHAGRYRTFGDYYEDVAHDSSGQSLAALIDALATNHSSFLREPDHFDFLRARVIPELMAHGAEIWSAAAATGEEIWTLAFLLNDALRGRQISIQATDISNKALQAAANAVYSTDRCRPLPRDWLCRYMTPSGRPPASYQVNAEIRRQAQFRRLNLISDFDWPKPFPVIFCRNVMIYFDRPTQERVVRRLTRFLAPGGYLFIGHAESLTGIAHDLQFVRPAIYRRLVSGRSR